MGSLGMQEIVIIFIIALIVFGPRKLPELGKTIGKGLAEFKKASNDLKQTWEDEVRLDKEKESMNEIIDERTHLFCRQNPRKPMIPAPHPPKKPNEQEDHGVGKKIRIDRA